MPSVAAARLRSGACGYARCAGGIAWGNDGGDACPPQYVKVTTEDACKRVAGLTGKGYYSQSFADPTKPSGCIWSSISSDVRLNTAAAGAGFPDMQPLCAGAHDPWLRKCMGVRTSVHASVCADVRACMRACL